MRMKKPKRTHDANQFAKFIADVATGDVELPKTDDGKNPAAVALGRLGGLKGGKARAESLSKKRRTEIAADAAKKRWANETSRAAASAGGNRRGLRSRATIKTPAGE
jgi:hypothetical protein